MKTKPYFPKDKEGFTIVAKGSQQTINRTRRLRDTRTTTFGWCSTKEEHAFYDWAKRNSVTRKLIG